MSSIKVKDQSITRSFINNSRHVASLPWYLVKNLRLQFFKQSDRISWNQTKPKEKMYNTRWTPSTWFSIPFRNLTPDHHRFNYAVQHPPGASILRQSSNVIDQLVKLQHLREVFHLRKKKTGKQLKHDPSWVNGANFWSWLYAELIF